MAELALSEMTLLEGALAYANRHLKVLPLHGIDSAGDCTCGRVDCSSPGKHPRIKNGVKGASCEPEQVRTWWSSWPDSNIGLAVGSKAYKGAGLMVLDIDMPDGPESLATLADEGMTVPKTLVQRTGGGGLHYLFRVPDAEPVRNNVGLRKGIDVRADNGYIVVAPSRHLSGNQYSWSKDQQSIATVPPWLLQAVRNGGQEKKPSPPLPDQIPPGTRNATLASLAGTMRRRGASEPVIRAALLEQNKTSCSPPLPEAEVAAIAASVARYPAGDSTAPTQPRDEPLPAPVWPALNKAALHGLAGEFVQLVEPHTEADPVALLAQFLVCFGNCIGAEPHFRVEADRHALNLFCCCVGETSKGRKGTSLGHVRNVCRSVDEDWDTERVQFGLSSGEGLIWAVRDPIEETKAQRQKGQPTTYEDVITDQGVSDKRLLVIEAEFASTLRVMNRETNTLSPVIRNAWDGGNLRILTKNSPARATGAHIGIIGHISKAELLQHLTRTEMGNGFGNRFLWLCVKRSKCLPEGGCISSVNFGPFLQELGRVVNRGKVTPEIRRDSEARGLWAEVYPELSSGKPGLLGAMIARSEAQAMRLACLYAALDGSMLVTIDHLRAALALWQYCEDSARYIFGATLGDPIADTILQSLKGAPAGLTRTEINQIFGGHKTTTQIDQAIILLRSQNMITPHKRDTGGRPVEYYRHAEKAE